MLLRCAASTSATSADGHADDGLGGIRQRVIVHAVARPGIAALEPDDVPQQRTERRRRSRNHARDANGIAFGLDRALAQVYEMALGGALAAAPAIGVGDGDPGKRVVAAQRDVAGDDAAVLERKDVERARQFVLGQQQRHRQAARLPAAGEAGQPVEIIGADAPRRPPSSAARRRRCCRPERRRNRRRRPTGDACRECDPDQPGGNRRRRAGGT